MKSRPEEVPALLSVSFTGLPAMGLASISNNSKVVG